MSSVNPPFTLTGLTIYHHRSTMKIGTDALLLGAYPKQIQDNDSVLEIGSGCGVITLMTAKQYGNANYVGIDIDEVSVEEFQDNIQINHLSESCMSHCSDIKNYASKHKNSCDVIISNPPFFTSEMLPSNDGLRKSKHTTTLSIFDLADSVSTVLKDNGKFYVILPISESDKLKDLLSMQNIYPIEILEIKSHAEKPLIRKIQVFCKGGSDKKLILKQLTINKSSIRNDWTDEYKQLLQDFKNF